MRERFAQYRREARRIRENAATAVRQQLIDKVRQLEELAERLEIATRQGDETP